MFVKLWHLDWSSERAFMTGAKAWMPNNKLGKATDKVLTVKVSQSTIRRLVKEVGLELADLEETDELNADKESVVPEIAVVSCDGGRIRTRV